MAWFHLFLHIFVPWLLAYFFFRNQWKKAFIIMLFTIAVDVDHFLATPVYDPHRCSIGFHALHKVIPVGVYIIMCFIPAATMAGWGLTSHMLLDSIDCYFQQIEF